jgi:arylsulfatase A-like enzyme
MKISHKFIFFLLLSVASIISYAQSTQSAQDEVAKYKSKGYNVLFVAIDDLNDWVGCLGGNSQVKTPNIDRFAKENGIVFNKAYSPSSVCCPSRSALLTGKRVASTGVYGNGQNLKDALKARNIVTLPEYFGQHGYYTLSAGKVFHKHPTAKGLDEGQWAFQEFARPGGSDEGKLWEQTPPKVDGIKAGGTDFAWGATKAPVEKTKDYVACKWAADQLQRDFDGKPFFLALGIAKPHLPWIVPQQFYDLYPLDKVIPVALKSDDLKDIVDQNGKQLFKPDARFELADKANMHKEVQRAYMANISYVDYCLGVLFEGLDKSKYANNTVVMIWGDHGWHLSEKMKYGKTDLWEESARVPFIVSVPGVTTPNAKTEGVVNLLDMYPTLIELCGLPKNAENEGISFAPLLKNPKMNWNTPTLTTYQYKNHSLTDGRYRYTWYGGRANGAEELYDHSIDPLEHNNLASNSKYKEIIKDFQKHLPIQNEPNSPNNKLTGEDKKNMTKGKKKNKEEEE